MTTTVFGLLPSTERNMSYSTNVGGGKSSGGGGDIIVGRVIDIILDDSDPEKFKQYGEWDSIGLVFYQDIQGGSTGTAKPIFPNIKQYPLVNEIIYILNLPNPEAQLIDDPLDSKSNITNQPYYFPPVNIWNSTHHNAIPLIKVSGSRIQNDYSSSQAGLVRQVSDGSTSINLNSKNSAQTFQERINIQPLLPYAGDVIYEGRWGQSIRFGSTVTGSFIPNEWSAKSIGIEGDPITLLRNGAWNNKLESWVNTLENINQDSSSVYLTSTQQIPLSASSINKYFSYSSSIAPTQPNLYSGSQVIINSSRLIFNSKEDHILFSYKKTINLNSQEGLYFDTIGNTVFQSDKIFLGTIATEPLLKGNITEALLNKMLNYIQQLNIALQSATTAPGGGPVVNLQAFASSPANTVNELSTNNIKSTQNFTI